MLFSASTVFLALASAVSAATPSCSIGKQQILYPAADTNITTKYHGATFPFRYCSGQYDKTSSRNIQVAFAFNGSANAIVVNEVNSTGSIDGGYVFNVTYPTIDGTAPHNLSVELIVLETYYNYYVPLGSTYSEIALKF